MDGLLLRLREDHTGVPGGWFWRLFAPIRPDLDRLFWCLPYQPWMGAPEGFCTDESATVALDEGERTSVQLWQPGALGRYADRFAEEFVELWGIEPTADDPRALASRYIATPWRDTGDFIRRHARVWLLYTDSTCWEIYARKARLLDQTREQLRGKPWVEVYESQAERRGMAFGTAGLSEVWAAMKGRDA